MLQPGAVRAHIKKGNSRSDSDGCSDEGRHRKLVWIEQQRFRGFGCSECAWVFNPSSAPNSELQRDWGKLSRAAVLESDRSRLLQRIEQAEAAILERSRSLSKSPGNNRKEQEVIARALQILSLLRKAGQDP
jgi:hypothetical protein